MLKETVFVSEHRRLGAKFINFHGWKLPLEFSGSTVEHLNVRKNSGLFDVSQMGEIRVRGKGALKFLEKYLTNNVSALKENQTQYNLLCNKQGGIIDDLILYCFKRGEDYLLCVNSACLEKDLAWLKQGLAWFRKDYAQGQLSDRSLSDDLPLYNLYSSDFPVEVFDESDQWAQLALQGPSAPALLTDMLSASSVMPIKAKKSHSVEERDSTTLSKVKAVPKKELATTVEELGSTTLSKGDHLILKNLKKNYFHWFSFLDEPMLVSATGYTGEKGFEILISPGKAVDLWRVILRRGKSRGCLPVGLAARDTLRMEMKYPLYGKDLNENIDPHSAGLSWAVRNPTNFIGSSALAKIKNSVQKKWVGFQLLPGSVGVPRKGHRIFAKGVPVGEVTSGAKSPSLCKMIGLGHVLSEYSRPKQKIQVEIHQKQNPAEVVATPFYKKHT